jgi:dienelactone hydrolase
MFMDLVRTTTKDGHRLDGALIAPRDGSSHSFDIDCVLMLHGVAGNFYSGTLFDCLAAEFTSAGLAVLRVNTRGRDSVYVSWTKSGPAFQGAAYEIVGDCRHDLAAWVEFFAQRGYSRIGVLGHSLGAIKALYVQAHAPLAGVVRVIACSPPRLSYSAFMNSDAQPRFFESMAEARGKVAEGQPNALILSKFPTPVWMSAAGYLDKYGPDEHYNILKFVDRVACPTLTTYGELELASGGIAFAGLDEQVAARRAADQPLHVTSIPGADHAYTGVTNQLAATILSWLRP